MKNDRIILDSDDGQLSLEVLEETTVSGISYILVTDADEDMDGECYVMKDVSGKDSPEAVYEFATEEEEKAVMPLFAALLEGEGITIEI